MAEPPILRVVGLGPGGPELLTAGTAELVRTTALERLFFRTRVHPAASIRPDAATFDDLYEQCETFEEVYGEIVEALVARAHALAGDGSGSVVYAVPGSPVVAEHTVELLIRDPRVQVRIEPALSFLDLSWARLRIDPVRRGVRVIDGHRFAEEAAALTAPAIVAQCHSREVLSDIKLAIDTALLDEIPVVTVLHHLGLDDEQIVLVAWDDLDRLADVVGFEADHLSSLYVPQLVSSTGRAFVALEEQMRALRAGCPWDRVQTHASLVPYLLEETYELVDAIDSLPGDPAGPPDGADGAAGASRSVGWPDPVDHFAEELGDLLFQIVFHAGVAAEQGWFTLADVAISLFEKLERRHPHVFGDVEVADAAEVVTNWERIKAGERSDAISDGGHRGPDTDPAGAFDDDPAQVFDDVPDALPALSWASKIVKRATRLGAGAPISGSVEVTQLRDETDFGAALLAVVAEARGAGVDPENALRRAAKRYRDAAIAARRAAS